MFSIRFLLSRPYSYYDYIWVDVFLVKETQKAILIEHDVRRAWFSNVWIIGIKRLCHCEERSNEAISIKISLYYWTKKFS